MSIVDVTVTKFENKWCPHLAVFNNKMYIVYNTIYPTGETWYTQIHLAEFDGVNLDDKKTFLSRNGDIINQAKGTYSKMLGCGDYLGLGYITNYSWAVKKFDKNLNVISTESIDSRPQFINWEYCLSAVWSFWNQYDDRHSLYGLCDYNHYGTAFKYNEGRWYYRRKDGDRVEIVPAISEGDVGFVPELSGVYMCPEVLYDNEYLWFVVTQFCTASQPERHFAATYMAKVDRFGTFTYDKVVEDLNFVSKGFVKVKDTLVVVGKGSDAGFHTTIVFEKQDGEWHQTVGISNAYNPIIAKDSVGRVYVFYSRNEQDPNPPNYWYTSMFVKIRECDGTWSDEIRVFDGVAERVGGSEYQNYYPYIPRSVAVLPVSPEEDRICIASDMYEGYFFTVCARVYHPVLSQVLTISRKKFSNLYNELFIAGHSDLLHNLVFRKYGYVIPDLSGKLLLRRYGFTEPPLYGELILRRTWWKELPSSLWAGLMYTNFPQKFYIGSGDQLTLNSRVNVYPIGKRIVEKLLRRLTTPYDKRIDSMNATFLKMDGRQIAELEIAIKNKILQSYVDTAEGVNLDRLGALFNLERFPGETDSEFRGRIKSAVPSLVGGGTLAELRRVTEIVTGSTNPLIVESYPAKIAVYAKDHPNEFSISTLYSMIDGSRAAGVKLEHVGLAVEDEHTADTSIDIGINEDLSNQLVVRQSSSNNLTQQMDVNNP